MPERVRWWSLKDKNTVWQVHFGKLYRVKNNESLNKIKFNKEVLEEADEFKYLGAVLYENGTTESKIEGIVV